MGFSLGNSLKNGIVGAALTSYNPLAAAAQASGVDLTPGFSLTNVAKTQAAKATAPKTTGTGASGAWQPTGNQGGGPSQTPTDAPSNPYTGYGAAGGAGGTAGASAGDAATAAYYDDQANQLERLLGSADASLANGRAGLNDSYNLQNSRLNEDQSRVLRDYGVKRQDTLSAKDRALEVVDTDARNGYNALQQLLQRAGGGVSSVARDVVPYAVALKGGQQRGQQLDTFGHNIRDLDTAEGDAKSQYQNALDDLFRQKREKEQGLESGVITQKQALLNQMAEARANASLARGDGYGGAQAAMAGSRGQFNALQNQLDQLFSQYRNPTYDVKPINVQTPNLADYTVDAQTIAAQQANPNTPSELLPYLPQLRDEEQNQYPY